MAGDATPTALRHVESLFRDGTAAGLGDGQLLARFADDPGGPAAEVAFAALVERHGAMDLRVCRQVLGDEHEAQDASQATFLVLARRARSIARRESVASWLHGVAVRVSARARVSIMRRRAREKKGGEMAAGREAGAAAVPMVEVERSAMLHEELGRLHEPFRSPLVLCYLEGLTQEQTAARLRWPLGTLQSRLARGRAKLKSRLARRGITASAALLTAGWAVSPAPAAWAEATVRAAIRFTTKSGAAALGEGPASAALAREVLKAMTFAKMKITLGIALLAVAASGAAAWTRLVRARVAEVPKDDPKAYLNWAIYTVDASGKPADEWQKWMLPNVNANDPAHMKRHLEVRLPAGRYKIEFRSETVLHVSGLDVPPGDGPYDLPEFALPSIAGVRMAGGPAAEIDATDLDGQPVRLADYRGKVVVLDFWATWCGPCLGSMPKLAALKERLKDQPLVILALHDASFASADEYRKAFAPIRQQLLAGKDLPFPVLLDRPPVGKSPRPYSSGVGEKGSGRTADTYEIFSWPSTFVIDRNGILVGKFDASTDALEGALEDQFGLPRTKPAPATAIGRAVPPETKGPTKVAGKVIGPDGRPVAGAKVQAQMTEVVERGPIKTGADGRFAFTAKGFFREFSVRVEAPPGLASKMFQTDADGQLTGPLQLGTGVTVTGRLVRDGKPVANVPLGIGQIRGFMDHFLGHLGSRTGADGRFRFEHAFTDDEFTAYARTGGLPGGGSVVPRKFKTEGDGTSVDLGDMEVHAGRTLAGRIVFADGRAIPPRTKVLGYTEGAGGIIWADVDDRGRFEVRGLPEGEVGLGVKFPDIQTWNLPGYRLSAKNKCMDPLNRFRLMGQLTRDISDLGSSSSPATTRRSATTPARSPTSRRPRPGRSPVPRRASSRRSDPAAGGYPSP
ncbi:MAG TPA: sigma-70 family RNA polymerase sigma factor [Isosphaeraceae bacterium]|nr:sigma-70 family RNA polymerase sigma factor [Isosphaeraceae bacterium]